MRSILKAHSRAATCLAIGLVAAVSAAGVTSADIVSLDQPAQVGGGAAAVRVRPPPPPPSPPPTAHQAARDGMFAAINQVRATSGLAPFQSNNTVTVAAQRHSDDMAATGRMSHNGSDGSDGGDRLTEAGFVWSAWGENIAAGFTDPVAVTQAWMGSSNHRRQLLGELQYVGIGIAASSDGTLYWTLKVAS